MNTTVINKTGNVPTRNIEAISWKHCCDVKALSNTHSESVFVTYVIQHAMRMRHIVFCSIPRSALIFQARLVAHRLWNLVCWSYFHPQQGHSCIWTRLQKSDPIFYLRVDVMKPVFNLEPNYRVTMLAREAPGLLLQLKGLSGILMGPGLRRGPGWGLWAVCK